MNSALLGLLTGLCLCGLDGHRASASDVGGRLNWPSRNLELGGAGQTKPVLTGIAIHPTAAQAVLAGDDHRVNLVDLENGRLLKSLAGHTDWVRAAVFTPDGQGLITAGADRRILQWDLIQESWSVLAEESSSIESIACSGDGRWLAAVGFEPTLRIYDLQTGRRVAALDCPCADLRSVAISPDGQRLAAGGRSGQLLVWERVDGGWRALPARAIHQQRIHAVSFLSNTTIATAAEDRLVYLTHLEREERSGPLARMGGKLFALVALDAKTLACGGSQNRIHLIDVEKKQVLGYLENHRGTVSALAYSQGRLLSGGFDAQARVWQTETPMAVAREDAGRTAPAAEFDRAALERSARSSGAGDPALLPIQLVR